MTFDDEFRDEATADSIAAGAYQPIEFATDVRAPSRSLAAQLATPI
jgi:hypothetical protein